MRSDFSETSGERGIISENDVHGTLRLPSGAARLRVTINLITVNVPTPAYTPDSIPREMEK